MRRVIIASDLGASLVPKSTDVDRDIFFQAIHRCMKERIDYDDAVPL